MFQIGEDMKNGLLRYDAKDGVNKNIGDYIQSVAAMQFVGSDSVLIEREQLHKYDGEAVKLIMNAWWMHYPENFPPTDKIDPLFISFHINPGKAKKFLKEETISYLRKYEPIGCRDKGTQDLLEKHGVKAYFSGCLTLTLGNTYKHNPKSSKVCIVEPYFPLKASGYKKLNLVAKAIYSFITSPRYLKSYFSISKKMFGNCKLKSIIKSVNFFELYRKYFDEELLARATYVSHVVYEPGFKSEKEKFDYTDQLLKLYANSALIITSRLHAGLPGLCIGTPTVFINNEFFQDKSNAMSPGRFGGLIEHMNVFECNDKELIPQGDFYNGRIGSHNIPGNSDSYKAIADNLTAKSEAFVRGAE